MRQSGLSDRWPWDLFWCSVFVFPISKLGLEAFSKQGRQIIKLNFSQDWELQVLGKCANGISWHFSKQMALNSDYLDLSQHVYSPV